MNHKEFLKEHAVYQIYPISFCDSNGDGYGDLNGITSKLDYLKDIGIHTIWLSPVYMSPMVDFGYDISDYRKINPLFGTMDDFDHLMEETKKRDMMVIMDLVVNHTSDQHAWFKEALKDKNSPYRDYYIFKQGKKDENGKWIYPNNWTSNFTGSAWEEVPNEEGMYYLHLFTKQQPDLNWHNPKVYEEVKDIIEFWMDKGVYGFRCDVISEIYKESYEDGKKGVSLSLPIGIEHYLATDGNHAILKRLQKDVISPRDGVLIGECGGNITIDDGKKFMEDELDTFFEFEHVDCYKGLFSKKIDLKKFKDALISWGKEISWSGNYLENHDQRRVFSRYVYGKDEDMGAKMLLVLLYTLKGTPFLYMGQEYGAHNYPKPLKMEECRDIVTQNVYQMAKGYHLPSFLAKYLAHKFGRDDERAPMAFDSSVGYGFSSKEAMPWQRYNPLCKIYNAEIQSNDKNGILTFFKKINQLREGNEILIHGTIDFSLCEKTKNVMMYIREFKGKKILVLINLSNQKRKIDEKILSMGKELLLSNYESVNEKLLPYQAAVFSLKE